LAASFISNLAFNVAYWHNADVPTHPTHVRYWGLNGLKADIDFEQFMTRN
jgi:hypothetical protein